MFFFNDLHVNFLMIFDYGKKKGVGAYKENGQKHACHSVVQLQALANAPWTSHCLCPLHSPTLLWGLQVEVRSEGMILYHLPNTMGALGTQFVPR